MFAWPTKHHEEGIHSAAPPGPWGVLLLAHGAPDRLEDIPEFLLNVRGGRPLPEPAVKEICTATA